jgi:hypothetical protein
MSGLAERAALVADLMDFVARPEASRFDALALRVVRFQAATVPAYGRLVRARGGADLARWQDAPRVPTDLFRDLDLSNLDADTPEVARFQTSGTTGPERRGCGGCAIWACTTPGWSSPSSPTSWVVCARGAPG